jgi:serine/threonine-protein kinase RsbW
LAEAINNVVEHAYAGRKPGLIKILCELQSDLLDIRICDHGGPMPQKRLPQGLALDVSGPRRDLPEGGFGWFLIRDLANEIWYDRLGDENHLLLRFGLPDN